MIANNTKAALQKARSILYEDPRLNRDALSGPGQYKAILRKCQYLAKTSITGQPSTLNCSDFLILFAASVLVPVLVLVARRMTFVVVVLLGIFLSWRRSVAMTMFIQIPGSVSLVIVMGTGLFSRLLGTHDLTPVVEKLIFVAASPTVVGRAPDCIKAVVASTCKVAAGERALTCARSSP